jgi:ABC-type polysaccharide/polyol phosphate export permease
LLEPSEDIIDILFTFWTGRIPDRIERLFVPMLWAALAIIVVAVAVVLAAHS